MPNIRRQVPSYALEELRDRVDLHVHPDLCNTSHNSHLHHQLAEKVQFRSKHMHHKRSERDLLWHGYK